eukprot:669627-Pelagomonas_calceolata.AAC.1
MPTECEAPQGMKPADVAHAGDNRLRAPRPGTTAHLARDDADRVLETLLVVRVMLLLTMLRHYWL